ncbi:MAG: hypothetical protein LBF15_00375 [Candidatus Peribacteria bacterium]|nr:hypothetical protein [Candidatus Peribacteria bacterium]
MLVLTMCFSLVGSAFAAPKDKILDDNVFMNYFNPSKAVTLNYGPGEKVAVSISSNAHFADYAKEGFWFIWGGDKDLGSLVSAKQKDTGFAVIAPFFFDKYKSLTITVKSSNEYRNVTFTEPGTYFIDQFLLKNEQKGPSGGYHNINWVGFSLKGNEKEYGYLKVTTNIGEEYEKSTYQPVWQKEIQPVWQKTIQPVWQRETQEVRQITYQTYNVPAYEREITGQINSGVSYVNLDYGILGGKMSDGMTYLELNVWEVKEYGATSMIVESSSNDVWTSYFYNVDISGNELTVSLSSAVPNT